MDQNRPDQNSNNSQQQQNVHLHMHHVCNCPGGIYPTYYPTMGYRTPLPPLVPYPAASAVSRPYMQHYQYTQFNVGGQYTVPLSHVSGSSTAVYGSNSTGASAIDLMSYGGASLKREREEGSGDVERPNDPPEGYECGQVTPPGEDLFLGESVGEINNADNFVKFLERSCLTAEQIAYRNRNRPCFRNIQNLCIRTRSEILKPCTTISNIHSQGIPWATKDFIYAFVRLTNCWHILKGYWDNRDGSALGKIEKELSQEFRAIYVRWEKETMDLATQLTRIFYNLDTNLNSASSGAANIYAANNMIPPQLNLIKSASEGAIKKTTSSDTATTSTITSGSSYSSKNIRGILHLPSASQTMVTETVDQGNQTYSADFGEKEEYDSEEERTRKVYMKPGSYNVPKKGLGEVGTTAGNSPRAIEFLETAQNVNKAREVANDRYWANIHLTSSSKKPPPDFKLAQEDCEEKQRQDQLVDIEMNLNVHEWLISSNFTEFGDPAKSVSMSQQELKPFYLDSIYDSLSPLDTNPIGMEKQQSSITLLQRSKCASGSNPIAQPIKSRNPRGLDAKVALTNGLTNRSFRKQKCPTTISSEVQRRNPSPYEMVGGGLTEAGQCVLESIVASLKGDVLGSVLVEGEMDLDKILLKIKNFEYAYVNEIVRDLRYVIKIWEAVDLHNAGWFSQKLDMLLSENLGIYDFNEVKGDAAEVVGPLKSKVSALFNSDCDQFI